MTLPSSLFDDLAHRLECRHPSVQANLFECGNMGRMAFLEVEDRMGAIQMTSQVINKKVRHVR